jgi:hypothetical protein
MDDEAVFAPDSWLNWDSFNYQFQKFNDAVHTLILWPVSAALSHLTEEAEKEDAALEPRFALSSGDEREYYIEQQQKHWQFYDEQERFLRNIALVGLLSLLTHTLNEMLRAVSFAPRKKSGYRKRDDSEFTAIWREFLERLSIDFFEQNNGLVAFLDPLREARNMIVHNGAEANKPKRKDKIIVGGGDEGYLDLSFSKNFPQFVDGDGFFARVRITEKQLDSAVDLSISLTRWVAQQLRARELAAAKERSGDPPQ